MNNWYILEGKKPVKCDDITEWGKQMKYVNRIVSQTIYGDVKVSTVFLGIDDNYGFGKPMIFETMIFGGEHDMYIEKYSTWDEAVKGHEKACNLVKQSTEK